MARRRAPDPADVFDGAPPELADRLHPIWRDAGALAAHPVLSAYLDDATAQRLNLGSSCYQHVLSRWADAHGFDSSPRYPGLTDWHALRAAGIIGP